MPNTNALLEESAKIAHDKAKLVVVYGQQKLEGEIVRTRSERTAALSKQALDDMIAGRSVEIATQNLISALLDQIRLYADTAHRYRFSMIRHAQRWLFETDPLPVSFGYGWIDPDAEMNLLDWRRLPVEGEARQALAVEGLKKALRGIVEGARLPETGSVRELVDRYIARSRSAKYDHLVIPLNEFVGGGSATAHTFSLSLTDLRER